MLYVLLRNAHTFYELFIRLRTVVKANKWIQLSEFPVAYLHHH